VGVALLGLSANTAQAQTSRKPNIVVIWGDDIGWYNVSAYNQGVMGYATPNIDRIARKARCSPTGTGSRAAPPARALHHRQSPIRTGLTKVGLPGAEVGCRPRIPTIAELLKPLGYAPASSARTTSATATSILPTAHGFDEFFGNLYHLNAEEEPETVDYPKNPEFKEEIRSRGA
jgi:arylsulfatase